MKTTTPLKFHGGKYYLADTIIDLMPEHLHYVEPYFGGGQVLFRKSAENCSEVANDLNDDLMNFWMCLANPKHFSTMVEMLEVTPVSERMWDNSNKDYEDPVIRAMAFFIRYRQSRQGLGKCFTTLSRNRLRRGMNEQVSSWLSAIEGLPSAAERLRQVVITCKPALKVIKSEDGENTFFFLDPPYLHATRVSTSAYLHEMTHVQHRQLLRRLARIKGRFILCGYRSKLYDFFADKYGWNRVDIEIDNKASAKKTKDVKTECLWMNYIPSRGET